MANNNAIRHISPAKRTIPGRSSELSVVIPAAGIGQRMKDKNPKSLIQLPDYTLIEHQIETIWSQFPKAEIIIVTGFSSYKVENAIQNYPVRVVYNPIFETTNVAFSIGLGLRATVSNHVLIIHGDLFFNKESISHIVDGNSKILVDTAKTFDNREVGFVIDENTKVTNLSYGLPQKWAQITYLKGRELDLFKPICYNEDAVRWFGYEALNAMLEKGGVLETHEVNSSYVIDLDTQQDVQKLNLHLTS